MRKIAIFVLLAYAVLFVLITWPVIIACFINWEAISKLPETSLREFIDGILSVFLTFQYWMLIGSFLLCEGGLLLMPLRIAQGRPTSKRTVYLPIIVSGLLAGALVLGMILSICEFIHADAKGFDENWQGWTAIGFCILLWIVWAFVFCRLSHSKEPKSVILRQCGLLLQGSIVSLLIAVPTHIVARWRDYCCAGFYTFVGITFGLAVMLISFGPGIYFLYAERWRKLHPKTEEAPAAENHHLERSPNS